MGDSGALLLGLLLAASTVAVGGSTSQPFSGQVYFFFAPLFIPLFILGVLIIDTLFAIVRRASRRSGLATADKDHLHHRLMRLGHGQRRSVLILWAWTAILSGLVLYPAYTGRGDAVVPSRSPLPASASTSSSIPLRGQRPSLRRTARSRRLPIGTWCREAFEPNADLTPQSSLPAGAAPSGCVRIRSSCAAATRLRSM